MRPAGQRLTVMSDGGYRVTVQGEDRRLIKDYLPLEVLTRSRRPPVSIRSESCPRWRSRHCRLLQIRFLLQVAPARLRHSKFYIL